MLDAENVKKILLAAAHQAGDAILRHVADNQAKNLERHMKSDGSFATDADVDAERIIVTHLKQAFPDVHIIGEELSATATQDELDQYFLIDPLDGTRGFARGSEQYTVNIALIEGGTPVAGVVHAPALNLTAVATPAGASVFNDNTELPLTANTPTNWGDRTALVSTQAPDITLLNKHFGASRAQCVKSSLKFVLLAQGLGQVYPRANRIMAWDTAAGQAVLEAVGGTVVTPDGQPLRYSSRALRISPFVAWSCTSDI